MAEHPDHPAMPLLQSNQELVQVPAQLLNSLLASVESLKKEIADLREEVKLVKGQGQHPRFARFSKLPVELRRMVWRFALTAPQIHIFGEASVTTSRVNIIMQACREARETGLCLKLKWYQITKRPLPEGMRWGDPGLVIVKSPRYFINWEVDTMWIPDSGEHIPEHIEVYCSCEPTPGDENSYPGKIELTQEQCRKMPPLGAVAINASHWVDPWENGVGWLEPASMYSLWYHGNVKTLFLVVNGEDYESMGRDSVFTKPIGFPRDRVAESHIGIGDGDHPGISWTALANVKVKAMEAYKKRLGEIRKEWLEEGMTEEEINEGNDRGDISNWVVPTVRFVDVRPSTVDWIPSRVVVSK